MNVSVNFQRIIVDNKSTVDQYNTTAAVISALNDVTNWVDDDFVDPGGILAQIDGGQVIFGSDYRFEYNGTEVRRFEWV